MGVCSRITLHKGVWLQLILQFVASKCVMNWSQTPFVHGGVRGSDVCLFCSVNHNQLLQIVKDDVSLRMAAWWIEKSCTSGAAWERQKWNAKEDPIFLTDWECLCLDVTKWKVSLRSIVMCREFHDRTWMTQYSWPVCDVCDYGVPVMQAMWWRKGKGEKRHTTVIAWY